MSGYLLESFVEPVDESLICRICRGVLNSPRKTPCGHVFCLSCLSSWIEYYGVCPNRCGDVELIEITHAVDIERCVFDLLKRCKYSSIGCKKQSKLSEIEQHERVCTYQHCGSKKPQQPNQEDMRRAAAPSLDCLFGRFGKAKKRPIPSTKPDNGHKEGAMQTELTFRLKRNKAVESLGLVLVSGSKNSNGNAEYFLVKEVHPNTLAAKAGMLAADRIVQVDGTALGRMNPGEAVARIKDKTLVTVTVLRGEKPSSHSHKEHIYDEILYSDARQFSLSQPDDQMFSVMSLEPPEQTPSRHSPQEWRRRVPLAPEDSNGHSSGAARPFNHDALAVPGQHHVEGSKDSGLSSGSNDSARLAHNRHQQPRPADMQLQQLPRGLKYSQQVSHSQDHLSRVVPARHSYRTEREMMRNGGGGVMQEGARSSSQDVLATIDGDSHRRNCRVDGNYELEEIYIQKNGTNQLGITLGYGRGHELLVCDVVPGGLAALDGRIKKGDVIRMVNGFSVLDPEEAILLFLEQDQDISLTVARKVQYQAAYDDRKNFRRIDSCGTLDSHTSDSKPQASRKPSNNSEDGYVHMNVREDLPAALQTIHVLPKRPLDNPLPAKRRNFDDPLPPTRWDPHAPTRRALDEPVGPVSLQPYPSAFFRPIQDDHRPRTEHPLVISRQPLRPMTTTPPMKHKTSVQLSAPPSAAPNNHIYGELEAPHYGYMRTESLV